jgi:hypothetical protein
MIEDMEARVKRGAALLDKHYPGWAEIINGSILDGLFDISEPKHCVLGTLELVRTENTIQGIPSEFRTPDVHFNGVKIVSWSEGHHYGFEDLDGAYWELGDLWREEVNART